MKLYVALAALVVATTLPAQEQKTLPSRTLLKLSPQHFIVSTLQIGTERFSRDFSRSWNLAVGVRNQGGSRSYSMQVRGAEIDFQYRKYVRPMQPFTSRKNRSYLQGVYVGPFVNGGIFSVDDEYFWLSSDMHGNPQWRGSGNKYNSRQVGGGFTIGLQRTFWDVITLDVFAGGGLRYSHINIVSDQFSNEIFTTVTGPGFSGIFPRIGFNIGITL